jgi:hypothetical protein
MSNKFKPYYENIKTGKTQWTIPHKSEEELPKINKAWIMQKSKNCGTIYYKHTKTGETKWDVPLDMFGGGTPPTPDNTFNNPFGKPVNNDKSFMFSVPNVNDLKNLNPDNINIPWTTDLINLWENVWDLTIKKKGIKKSGTFKFLPDSLKIISRFNDNGETNPKDCYVMMNKCKAPADKFILNTKEKMPVEITTIISNIQDEIQKPPPVGRRNMFLLPSQLNAAEYPNQNTIVTSLSDYFYDSTGGPRAQLTSDPAIAQFILDNASNVKRSKGINNVRLMGDIKGVTLKNGYLQVENTADTKEFEKRLPEMTILGVRDVPVRGLNTKLDDFQYRSHTVDLIYGSAVPIGGKDAIYDYGNSDHVNVQKIAFLTLFAQYVGAMRLAVTRRNCDLIMMPLGGKAFANPLENIRSAIINAYNFMKDDLDSADVRVAVLAWEDSEIEIFKNSWSYW